jgi:hypothetical protein
MTTTTFTLSIECDNDVFQEFGDPAYEVTRIMRDLADRWRECRNRPTSGEYGPVFDSNGNSVGRWEITEEDS